MEEKNVIRGKAPSRNEKMPLNRPFLAMFLVFDISRIHLNSAEPSLRCVLNISQEGEYRSFASQGNFFQLIVFFVMLHLVFSCSAKQFCQFLQSHLSKRLEFHKSHSSLNFALGCTAISEEQQYCNGRLTKPKNWISWDFFPLRGEVFSIATHTIVFDCIAQFRRQIQGKTACKGWRYIWPFCVVWGLFDTEYSF